LSVSLHSARSTLSLHDALPISPPTNLLLLAGNRLCGALAGTRIGVRALATNRQRAAVAQAAIAAQVHQPLDIHRNFATQIALDLDRKSTRLNSSHVKISYAVFC